ncbi:hypothetical protein NHP190012_00480 [Helicobacter sp. NHP19-012]|uniref:Secreted protein n=1 Tax=Helicobacter gastrofelis TaxID=2849642 RepID=A0ABM7SJV7_9HELI|nr:hypothetical protein [Helicobacter sp. NHP19-012]BCZ18406.1 hypothetical protein NHP190012_00480 [Helicobacter sp. NHP19-012]
MRLCLSLVFITLFAPSLCAEFSLQAIDDAVREMAVYQVSVCEDITLFNDQLKHSTAKDRKRQKTDTNDEKDLFKESTILFQVLQEYYTKDMVSLDYLEGVFQGYKTILEDALKDPHLAPLIPLLHEIVDQLQTMANLERKLVTLIDE